MEKEISLINYAPHTDGELLDAYSRTITGVVGQVAEAVVHYRSRKPVSDRRTREQKLTPGSGSDLLFLRMGL